LLDLQTMIIKLSISLLNWKFILTHESRTYLNWKFQSLLIYTPRFVHVALQLLGSRGDGSL